VSETVAVEALSVEIGNVPVLSSVSLLAPAGKTLVLLGPSGSGKTTLLRALLGLSLPSHGVIRIGAREFSRGTRLFVAPEERNLSVVFQDLALWPHLTVAGNLAFGLDSKKVDPRDRDAKISTMLERVGMRGKERRHPDELSGGERQRVAIARALVLDPSAVLMDEPLANLDVVLKRELLRLFRELFRERSSTVVYVTHDPREALALGDLFAVLEQGRLTQIGTPSELRAAPATSFVRELTEERPYESP
jgi:iron(III) transport system ATP-binding protein